MLIELFARAPVFIEDDLPISEPLPALAQSIRMRRIGKTRCLIELSIVFFSNKRQRPDDPISPRNATDGARRLAPSIVVIPLNLTSRGAFDYARVVPIVLVI